MNDPLKTLSLSELAALVGAEVCGDADYRVYRPASLDGATSSDISFYSDRRHRESLRATRAGAVILAPEHREFFSGNRLVVDDPYRAFVDICRRFAEAEGGSRTGIHPRAVIHESATLGSNVAVGPHSVIEAGVLLDDDVVIGANVYVGTNVKIGRGSRIASSVCIHKRCSIGAYCHIESGAVIGSQGFGYLESDGRWEPVPQIGSVVIGERVDVGANTTIDRGALDDTVIEDGVKLDNQIQIAHNVFVGADTAIAGCTGIAGSARIGMRCRIGGRVSILGHLVIGNDVTVLATSVVTRSVKSGGVYSSNLTVQPAARWRRVLARLPDLDELFRRVRRLEKSQSAGKSRD